MAKGIKTGDTRGFNKGYRLKFREGSRVRQTHEEGQRTYRPKRCGNENKDEDNSPKTFNDKNHQASSQKFRQLRKLMTMHKALHPRDDVDRLYVSRKGGRGLASIEDYIHRCGGRLITITKNNSDNTRTSRTTVTRKQKWEKNNCMDVLSD